ncbi:MAG TPA: glycosyl hydrolase family 28-related protein [Bacteroidales bacterium]|nr:glycosyl hydrolase family 28-related protein [Bacteroidales bacterium]
MQPLVVETKKNRSVKIGIITLCILTCIVNITVKTQDISWEEDMKTKLEKIADSLTTHLNPWEVSRRIFKAEDYGAIADGSTMNTAAIQKAINACSKAGGGIVLFSSGDYLTGTIILRSGVMLEISKGARILGSTSIGDYPEMIESYHSIMSEFYVFRQSLIYAEKAEKVGIRGKGEIYFRGEKSSFHGSPDNIGKIEGRPLGIRMIECKDVVLQDITLRSSAAWMQNYLYCENLIFDGMKVINHANYNNDGLDADGCRNMKISMIGGGESEMVDQPVEEKESGYPDAQEFSRTGLPAYGFNIRHARNINLFNIRVVPLEPDARPLFKSAGDVKNVMVNGKEMAGSFAQAKYPDLSKSHSNDEISNQTSDKYMPVIGVWVWGEEELLPDGFKKAIDQAGNHSPFNLLIPFLRFPDKEVVENEIHDQVRLAADYAAERNIGLVADLDIRSARRAFKKEYPGELQKMLRIKEIMLSENDSAETVIPSLDLNDHYSGGNVPHHYSLDGTLLRVYAYHNTAEGIEQESLEDITTECDIVWSSKDSVKVRIPPCKTNDKEQTHACVMVSFTHLYPDVYSPHLLEFQRKIIRQYSDVRLAGVCKDEWGFPPYYPRFYRTGINDFWYSKSCAQAYAEKTGGRELLADCLLMAKGIKGKESERQMAINHFMEMTRHRNVAIEDDFYHAVKEVFGPDAAVTVHSTWWPYPDLNEYKKNGLDWWASTRDWAQTDEVTPYAVRTALSKKWKSPVWYNMYYKKDLPVQVWSSALAGGRINYLPFQSLFSEDLMRAESRIRLLNYISKSPVDCPVAVIFGHACTMNWAGPHHDDVGMLLVDSLWKKGYPADLIPTSEIENGSLQIDSDGYISYGDQRYTAVVLYHPEFEKNSTAEFFLKADRGNTAMFRIGEWTKDFKGSPLDGNKLLPESMISTGDMNHTLLKIPEILKKNDIPGQTPATGIIDNTYFGLRDFSHSSCSPATTGFCRLIDGTVIHIAGTGQISGDTIKSDFKIQDHDVSIDAIGVAAVRLDEKGQLQALAAGSLKYFKAGNFELRLDERMDIALWLDGEEGWQGVIQGNDGAIPEELMAITKKWTHLNLPVPPE